MFKNKMSEKIFIIILFILYFSTRFINLRSLPIFNDEAIYLHWALIMRDTSNKFFSMVFDGKQPLEMWLFGISMRLIKDPLIAGRIVAIFFGLLAFLGVFLLSKYLGGIKFALMTLLFYIFTPYVLFFDRLALMESAINALNIWSIYLILRIFRFQNPALAIILGFFLAVGFWIKSTSFIIVLLTVILFIISFLKDKNKRLITNLGIILLTFIFFVFPLVFQNSFSLVIKKNQEFIFSLGELIKFPFNIWLRNFLRGIQVLSGYISPLFIPILILAVFLIIKEKKEEWIFFLFWSVLAILILVLFSKNLDSRYQFFIVSSVLIITSYLFLKSIFAFFILFLPSLFLSIILLVSPIKFFSIFPNFEGFTADKNQYIIGWPSGYGVDKVVEFLKEKSKQKEILVGVRLDSGNPEDALWVYFWKDSRIKIAYFLRNDNFWQELKSISSKIPIYFVSRDNQLLDKEEEVKEEIRFYKPQNKNYLGVYKIL